MPSEESPKEQAHALAVRAREALPQREAKVQPTAVEIAVGLLTQAVERLTAAPHQFVFDATPEQRDEVERIFASIRGRSTDDDPYLSTFVISFPDVVLPVSDIWPQGNAPESPTPEDVVEVMREGGHATPLSIIQNWDLIESLFVRAGYDEDGAGEVEWDGS